jgi:hypothetical protein
MKLPNGANAEIPMQKLTGYCFNPEHPKAKHKAGVISLHENYSNFGDRCHRQAYFCG